MVKKTQNAAKITSYIKSQYVPLIVIGIVVGLLLVVFLASKQSRTGPSMAIVSISPSNSDPESAPQGTSPTTAITSKTQTSTQSPSEFGYTKLIDLPRIGVRAYFPDSSKANYLESSSQYGVNLGNNKSLQFYLYDYNGGGRREWYQTVIGTPACDFEPFSNKTHNGYICGNNYFTVANSNKMLLVQSFSIKPDEFKAFLSGLTLISSNPAGVDRSDQQSVDTLRKSTTRKTLWEDASLGLKITSPDWFESYISGSWQRSYPEAKVSNGYVYINTGSPMLTQTALIVLGDEHTGKSFDQVAADLLFPAGFCSTEFKAAKSECQDPNQYCYTRQEVVDNLIVMKSVKFGPYDGELRSMRADFSQEMDCRAGQEWLIKAKNGRFVSAQYNLQPSGDEIRLEGM